MAAAPVAITSEAKLPVEVSREDDERDAVVGPVGGELGEPLVDVGLDGRIDPVLNGAAHDFLRMRWT